MIVGWLKGLRRNVFLKKVCFAEVFIKLVEPFDNPLSVFASQVFNKAVVKLLVKHKFFEAAEVFHLVGKSRKRFGTSLHKVFEVSDCPLKVSVQFKGLVVIPLSGVGVLSSSLPQVD